MRKVSSQVGGVADRTLPCWGRGLPCESEGPLTHRVSWGHGGQARGYFSSRADDLRGPKPAVALQAGEPTRGGAKPVATSQAVKTT